MFDRQMGGTKTRTKNRECEKGLKSEHLSETKISNNVHYNGMDSAAYFPFNSNMVHYSIG